MSSGANNLIQCYNKGCGQIFDPTNNTEESCTFHPGVPVFHDGFQAWSCCENVKKCRDFSEFLNLKGCATSKHNDVKPEKPKQEEKKEQQITVQPRVTIGDFPRPSEDEPMQVLKVTLLPSLKQALDARKKNKSQELNKSISSGEIQIGTPCTNNGCRQTFESEASDLETCLFHSGSPIFHEGMKYWSCCNKKTTDFSSFLEQVGCETGSHVWVKKTSDAAVSCRHEWHQTGSHVYVSVYAKTPDPDQTVIKANGVKLELHVVFDQGVFDMDLVLMGVISVEESLVTLGASKIEIKMKKAHVINWKELTVPKQETSLLATGDVDISDVKVDDVPQVSMEGIDLSDLKLEKR